jgi:hypothetical protein
MALSKEVQERIKKAAEKHCACGMTDTCVHRNTYISAATKEAELAQPLLSTLQSIKQCCEATGKPMDLVFQSIWNQADKAERGYNKTEIKTP